MFAEMCDLADRQTQMKAFPSSPEGMAEVKVMIMQHFSHYMCYYYIMSCYYIIGNIKKALNVICFSLLHYAQSPYYVMRL